jgi:hypothetical protein
MIIENVVGNPKLDDALFTKPSAQAQAQANPSDQRASKDK